MAVKMFLYAPCSILFFFSEAHSLRVTIPKIFLKDFPKILSVATQRKNLRDFLRPCGSKRPSAERRAFRV